MFADVHAHLTHDLFKNDLPDVVKRAKDVIIHCAGSGIQDNQKVLELSKSFPNVKACLGLYPWDAVKIGEDLVDECLRIIKNHKDSIVCIGEVGLDHFEGQARNDWSFQEWVFDKALELASEIKKPVLIHSRKAELDVLKMIGDYDVKVIIHCFTGKNKLVSDFIERGCYFSIPSNVNRASNFQELVKLVPSDRLLTETDAPFMSNVQGGRSEPCHVKDSVKVIAGLKGVTPKKMEEELSSNYARLFS